MCPAKPKILCIGSFKEHIYRPLLHISETTVGTDNLRYVAGRKMPDMRENTKRDSLQNSSKASKTHL